MEVFALSCNTASKRRQRIPAFAAAAALTAVAFLLVTGCSSSSTPAAGPATVSFGPDTITTPGMVGTGTTGPMPITVPMPGDSGSATAAPAASDAPQGANAVNISNFAFVPATLTVPVGTTVTWTNKDEEPHTVVSSDGSTFHSPGLDTGKTFSFTFPNAGTFDYICSIHPMMHGTVVVTK
jgi:plastocyanin